MENYFLKNEKLFFKKWKWHNAINLKNVKFVAAFCCNFFIHFCCFSWQVRFSSLSFTFWFSGWNMSRLSKIKCYFIGRWDSYPFEVYMTTMDGSRGWGVRCPRTIQVSEPFNSAVVPAKTLVENEFNCLFLFRPESLLWSKMATVAEMSDAVWLIAHFFTDYWSFSVHHPEMILRLFGNESMLFFRFVGLVVEMQTLLTRDPDNDYAMWLLVCVLGCIHSM